jgi:DNA-directed RNA polymerase subunit alpha
LSRTEHRLKINCGVKEDVLNIILNLKKIRFKVLTDEPQAVTLKWKGAGQVNAKDIEVSGQVEVLTPDQYICEVTDKKAEINIEMYIQKGLGYVSKEDIQKEKMSIGHIAVDAIFTPIRRVSYEVENMRVGDSTNYNRLRISVETDGTYTPREAVERAIEIMILQLQSIHDFKGLDEKPEEIIEAVEKEIKDVHNEKELAEGEDEKEIMKTRIEDLNLSTRTLNALTNAKIRTVGGIARKTSEDLLAVEGMGDKGLQEIKRTLSNFGILLK